MAEECIFAVLLCCAPMKSVKFYYLIFAKMYQQIHFKLDRIGIQIDSHITLLLTKKKKKVCKFPLTSMSG